MASPRRKKPLVVPLSGWKGWVNEEIERVVKEGASSEVVTNHTVSSASSFVIARQISSPIGTRHVDMGLNQLPRVLSLSTTA